MKPEDIINEARERYADSVAYWDEFRQKWLDDMKFIYEDEGQWEDEVLSKRRDRPCYTFNRTEGAVDQIVGDQRQSRPAIKIRAAEGGDKKTAETLSGLVRNIENISDAETIQDQAFTFAVGGGFGVWRIVNEFNADDSFEQDIKIKEIANPLSAHPDPAMTDICGRDSRYWIIEDMMPRDVFKDEFPGKEMVDFESQDDWFQEKEVRIAEYYRKIQKNKRLLQFSDGVVTFEDEVSDIIDELESQGVTIVNERQVNASVVEWYKISGKEILEGPIEYNWSHIPVVPVYGKRVNIEGKYLVKGITRNAKDPQRSYNYIRSVMTEKALMTPKFSYILTPAQIKGYQSWWDQAHSSPDPYIMANYDKDVGMPTPASPTPVPVELIQISQMDADDIKTATGFFDPSLGQTSNETSGKAILARQREGDVGSYVYIDNLSKAIRFTGEILVEMIPDIYDTERQVRILGEDGSEDYTTLNQVVKDKETGKEVILNDMSVGKYDVAVTVGPSYTTLRQESAERLIGLANADPELMGIGRDIIIKNMDIPGSTELEGRLRKIGIQQGIIEPTEEELQENPPEPPDPMEEQIKQLAIEKLMLENEELRAEIAAKDASTQKDIAAADESDVDAAIKKAEFINGDPNENSSVQVR